MTNNKRSYIYVVHKHHGRALHYDFRLEINGVLKSWAVPKGPSLNPKNKRLSILTTDHNIEYANFEGYIDEESYGSGPVIIWDKGNVKFELDPVKGFESGKLSFELVGKKLNGLYSLFTLKNSFQNWLLVKKKDKFASYDIEITEKFPESVISKLTLEDIEKLYKKGKIKPYKCG